MELSQINGARLVDADEEGVLTERISPTVRLRRLVRGIRRWRTEAGLRQEDVIKALAWSKPKLSRLENADQAPGPAEVLALAAVYGVSEKERDEYVALALQARQKGWWRHYSADTFLSNAEEYVGLESEADLVREFATDLIPGLLQTERYAIELTRAWIPEPDDEITRQRAELRKERQRRLFEPNPLELHVVIHESALRCLVGGEDGMREQLAHLVRCAKLPNVMLRVLPFTTGAVPALGDPFIVLTFPNRDDHDVAYTEHLTGCVYLEDPDEIEAFNLNYSALESRALSKKQSMMYLNDLIREL